MADAIVACAAIDRCHCQYDLRLAGDISSKDPGKRDLKSSASRPAAITLVRDQVEGLGRANHAGAQEYLHHAIEIAFHKKNRLEIINMDVAGFFLKYNLEALPIP